MNFRLDINGLRFIAVTMVVLFHFKIGLFYGGYAGVDVFFVISGFLMQEICSKEIGLKKWVTSFYLKRFKRIYPALFIMVFFTFLLALYSETPLGLREFIKQSLGALTFTSNIYFLLQSDGYFSTSSDLSWLLHTWSLSLEWQYYLVFPLIIKIGMLLKAYRNYFYFSIIVISLIISSIIGFLDFGDKIVSANFYLLPTRMWELMIGAYVSVLSIKNRAPKTTEIFSILCLIFFAVFVKDSKTWPGLITLIPVLATALIIHANLENSKTLFKNRVIQYIGSASYSIYLFHWPIVSFMANNSIEFNLTNSLIGVTLSITFGVLSYKCFERLFRKNYGYLFVTVFAFLVLSITAVKTEVNKLWVSRDSIELDKLKDYAKTKENKKQFGNDARVCFLSSENNDFSLYNKDVCLKRSGFKKNILLIGDSHAAQLFSSMRDVFFDYNVMQATASGCMPLTSTTGSKRCTDLINYIYKDYLRTHSVDYIFISANWVDFKGGDISKELVETVRFLGGDNVFIVGQTKVFSIDFYKLAQKIKEDKINNLVTLTSININEILHNTLGLYGVRYIDVFDMNCEFNKCIYFDENKVPMFFDRNHLTKNWADKYVKYLRLKSGI